MVLVVTLFFLANNSIGEEFKKSTQLEKAINH